MNPRYAKNTSTHHVRLATFREQMADYARGQRLRELRTAKHVSQQEAAQAIGITMKTLSTWENGRGKIRWTNAKAAAAYYGCDPEELVSRENPAGEANVVPLPTSRADAVALLRSDLADLKAAVDENTRRLEEVLGYLQPAIFSDRDERADAPTARARHEAPPAGSTPGRAGRKAR